MAGKRVGTGGGGEGIRILRAIWNEMKALNARVDQTNARLDLTNTGLDAVRTELRGEIEALRRELRDEVDGLRRRVVESEVRLATVTTQLSSDVQALTGLIREWREEHRTDRAEMKLRITRLEEHAGLSPGGR
jgi:chromosome segregation ATPase